MTEPTRLSGTEVEPPPVAPYRYGLLSAATVQSGADRRWEIAGVQYLADGCAPTGGIWLDPCYVEPLPDPVEEQAFEVAIDKAADGDTLVATLTARNAGYGTGAVIVSVDGDTKTLATVNATQSWTVTPSTTVTIAANILSNGQYPACGTTAEFAVPATAAAGATTLECTVEVPPEYPTKTIELGLDPVQGRPFMVYESASCGVGLDAAEATARADRRLLLHEQYWVEQHFTTTELRGAAVDTPNGTTALPFLSALGLLEREIAARYGGLGVIHASRDLAPWAAHLNVAYADGDRQRTELDNLWAFGSGYSTASPTGVAAPDGQAWLYATGPVVIKRSEIQTRTDFSTTRNIRMALAERAYVVTADCLRLAVLAALPGSP
jgi:hypothetical protein